MILVLIVILSIYGILVIAFSIGFDKVKEFTKSVEIHKTKISIIVPFRNEEQHLGELLNSLSLLNYPREFFEILMVNDESDDESIKIIENFKTEQPTLPIIILENLRKSVSPKKDAIKTAIIKAHYDWIITTDADCFVPKNWLKTYDAFIQTHKPKLVAAPVTYTVGNLFLEQFQLFDFLSMQAATIGGFGIDKPFLCNGANLCYKKSAFIEVNGFEGNTQIASGDDIFLMEKIRRKFPDGIHYLKAKEAIVITKPQTTFSSLVSQRVRWAAKTSSLNNSFTKLVGIVVLLMNFLLILTVILIVFGYLKPIYLLLVFGFKMILDAMLLIKAFRFFKQPFRSTIYLLSGFCYPVFSMFVVVQTFKKEYNWKNRTFKK